MVTGTSSGIFCGSTSLGHRLSANTRAQPRPALKGLLFMVAVVCVRRLFRPLLTYMSIQSDVFWPPIVLSEWPVVAICVYRIAL